MRNVISVMSLLGLSGFISAQDNKADPVGTWKCQSEIRGQKRESTLTFKRDGDKLVGTMTWQGNKEVKLEDLKFKDGELAFSAVLEELEMKFTMKYKLKIEGDSLKGKGATVIGGETKEYDLEGKRETKDK